MTTQTEHPHVVKNPEIRGGKAVIAGTRIPVWLLVANTQDGISPDEIDAAYPELTLAQIHDALSYYYDHPEEIDAEIRAQRATSAF